MSAPSINSAALANADVASMPTSNALSRKISKSASDFEAILLGSWIEKAEDTFAVTEDGSTDPGSSTYRQLGAQAIAQMMANHDVLGIARMVSASLAKSVLAGSTQSGTNSSSSDVDK